MKRRVVEQGGLTLMISLPRKWAKKYGLKKGDEIELAERGKELLLSTAKGVEEETSTTVEVKDPEKFMGRVVVTPYKFGYDKIEVRYSDASVVPKIYKYLQTVMGFEVVEQGTNYMKIEVVAKELEAEFDKMLRRMMTMTYEMAKALPEAARKRDKNTLNEIASMEEMNNKLTNFCIRILNKHGYTDVKKTSFLYCTVWVLEQVADEIKKMCAELASDEKVNDEVIKEIDAFSRHVQKFTEVFYKYTYDDLWDIRREYFELMKRLGSISAKTKTEFRIISSMMHVAGNLRHLEMLLF
jgi:phosphate uptake regulator